MNFEERNLKVQIDVQTLTFWIEKVRRNLQLTKNYAMTAVGARIRRGCMFRHVSVELSEDGDWKDESWERNLVSLGYQGIRSSIWAMQVSF